MEDSLILCPKCRQPFLNIGLESVICPKEHKFKIDEGVLVLAPDYLIEEKFSWSRKLRDPQQNLLLDKKRSVLAKKKSRKIAEDEIDYIIKKIPKKDITLLDIGTGRGLLLRQMYPALQDSIFYLNDISTHVLVGTNKLVKPLQRSNKSIPVQSSATDLPFDNSSLKIVTCFGPKNIKPTIKAFQEIFRILKKGGRFIYSTALFEKGSPSHKYTIEKEGGSSNLELIDKWQAEVEKVGFKIKDYKVIFDGPAEMIPLDVFPRVSGERYQYIGVTLVK